MSNLIKNTYLFDELSKDAKEQAYSEWIECFEHPMLDEALEPVNIIESETGIEFNYWDVSCEGYIFELSDTQEVDVEQTIDHLTQLKGSDKFCNHRSSEVFVKTLRDSLNIKQALEAMFEDITADLVKIYSHNEFEKNWSSAYYYYDHGTISGVRNSSDFQSIPHYST